MNATMIHRRATAAFTLAETMVGTAVFTLVFASIIALYLLSGRVTSGVNRSLELGSRAGVLDVMTTEIKSCLGVSVGTYNGTTFTAIPVGELQQGNALRLTLPTTGTNTQLIQYWVDNSKQLVRWDLNANRTRVYLTDITNTVAFTSETFAGAVISNQIARTLIDINLQILDSNPNNFRQYLKLQASAEKRNL